MTSSPTKQRSPAFWTPDPVLGDPGAEREWGKAPERAQGLFLHTRSYESFQKEHFLYLVGRRGTGKTAILRMMQAEVRQAHQPGRQRVGNFVCAFGLEPHRAFARLAMQMRAGPLAYATQREITDAMTEQWTRMAHIAAMYAVLWQRYQGTPPPDWSTAPMQKHIQRIQRYLITNNYIPADRPHDPSLYQDPLEHYVDNLIEALSKVDDDRVNYARMFFEMFRRLTSVDYQDACESMHTLLTAAEGTVLITVDSMDDYNLTDPVCSAIAASLIHAVQEFYSRPQELICLKIALPSEIYPDLPIPNRSKVDPCSLFIHWSYADLLSFAAIRFRGNVLHRPAPSPDPLINGEAARQFLTRYLPPKISLRQGSDFDSLGWIIRHTQKGPRQLLMVLNMVLTLARSQGESTISARTVRHGTLSVLDSLVEGSLQVLEISYPGVRDMVAQCLDGAPAYLSKDQLDRRIKRVNSFRNQWGLEAREIVGLLVECGAIGRKVGVHHFHHGEFILWEAEFQYQVPNRLTISDSSTIVIHPMFYDTLNTQFIDNIWVYPVPREDSERDVLSRVGASLGGA